MGTLPGYTIGLGVLILLYAFFQYTGKLPSIESVQALANVVNTKGGNILALAAFSLVFFFTGLGLIYWSLNRMMESKLTVDNAVLMMGLSWISGTAFGGAFSSMLKVMSGEESVLPPAKDKDTPNQPEVK